MERGQEGSEKQTLRTKAGGCSWGSAVQPASLQGREGGGGILPPSVPKLLILSRALQLEAERGSDLAPRVFSQQLFWGFGTEPCACGDGNPSAVGAFTCERRKDAHLPRSLRPLACNFGHGDAAPRTGGGARRWGHQGQLDCRMGICWLRGGCQPARATH